ncbi:Protein-lysine N-methyltransferase EFM2-like protein 2 [Coniochaeta hoffmannii]|uniref:Protein-lysine N-methyltransferase EFM2-like protein 2 n=1 Tax=Coniochaeta hoffmannii TaxID=91930 RepID=A0AA38SAV6_9PEZI|nr:Protein-lysine N-methyltransferase EFM2-like protein 2 [Coniochaeta hoffmannii]
MGPARKGRGHARPPLPPPPPTSSLPPLRQPESLTESRILGALDSLSSIYCPGIALPTTSSVLYTASEPFKLSSRFVPDTDSGYNSGHTSADDEEEDDDDNSPLSAGGPEAQLERLRADEHERAFAVRWVTRFIAVGDELPCFETEEGRQGALERAAEVLNALVNAPPDGEGGGDRDEEDVFTRDFTFALPGGDDGRYRRYSPICVRVGDGLAGRRGEDHLDVGLQTWGAAIVLCQMMCDDAARFGLTRAELGGEPSIVELGAGTGLVSLVLGRLLPMLGVERPVVVATDYHPAVIANLEENVRLNYGDEEEGRVDACKLDWAEEEVGKEWPLGEEKADLLIATDVVYAAEHARMLCDCASRLLAARGVFWLLATVRQNGRFNGVDKTVEDVFGCDGRANDSETGKRLTILESQELEKRSGVGRGDETFYKLFRIGWA